MPKAMKRSNREAKIRKDILAILNDPVAAAKRGGRKVRRVWDSDAETIRSVRIIIEIYEKLNERYEVSLAEVKHQFAEIEREDRGPRATVEDVLAALAESEAERKRAGSDPILEERIINLKARLAELQKQVTLP